MLAPLALAAFVAGLRAANLRLPGWQAGELLREMNEILGSAAASAGPAAESSSA